MSDKNFCRVCAGKKSLIDVFNPENEQLIEIIKVCTEIEIKRDDQLPTQICKACKDGIEFGYKLRALGESNERKFQGTVEKEEDVSDAEEASNDDRMEVDDDCSGADVESDGEDDDYSDEEMDDDIEDSLSGEDCGESKEVDEERDPLDCDDMVWSLLQSTSNSKKVQNRRVSPKTKRKPQKLHATQIPVIENDMLYEETDEVIDNDQDVYTEDVSQIDIPFLEDENDMLDKESNEDADGDKEVYTGEFNQTSLEEFHRKVCDSAFTKLMEPIVEGKMRFKCSSCETKFVTESRCLLHVRTHVDEKVYKCRVPGCIYAHQKWLPLRSHLRTHCEERKFECKKCGSVFKLEETLLNHKQNKKCKIPVQSDIDESVLTGDLEEDKIIEYHKNVSKKPTTWKSLLERGREEGKPTFKCKSCGLLYKESKNLNNFINHAIKHTGEKTFICRLPGCTNAYGDWNNLVPHLRSHCNKRNFACQFCDKAFNHQPTLKKHELTCKMKLQSQKIKTILKSEGTAYSGSLEEEDLLAFHKAVSEKPMSWKKILERKKVDGKVTLKCKVCGADQFPHLASFIRHALPHTGERSYKCRVFECSKTYNTWSRLKEHLMLHCDKKPVCEICGATFKSSSGLRRHSRLHKLVSEKLKEREHKSSVSASFNKTVEESEGIFDKENPSLEELISFHQNYKSTVTQLTGTDIANPWKCKVLDCTSRFADFATLEGHLLSHCDKKEYVCDICGQYFKSRKILVKHMPIHEKERLFKCKYCSATFLENKLKDSHQRRHNPGNEVLIKCDLCDSVFLNTMLRRNHLRREHGINVTSLHNVDRRRHACTICEKSFKTRPGLRDHILDHTNEMKYKCQYCSATFKKSHYLHRHEEQHGPEDVLSKCDLCDSVFLGEQLLSHHLKRDHGIQVFTWRKKKSKPDSSDEESDY